MPQNETKCFTSALYQMASKTERKYMSDISKNIPFYVCEYEVKTTTNWNED